jgi:hypothetical protein
MASMYKLRLINVCLAIGGRPLQDRHPGAEVAAFRGMQRTRAQDPNAVIVAEYWGTASRRPASLCVTGSQRSAPQVLPHIVRWRGTGAPEQWFRQQTDDPYERIDSPCAVCSPVAPSATRNLPLNVPNPVARLTSAGSARVPVSRGSELSNAVGCGDNGSGEHCRPDVQMRSPGHDLASS